MRPLLHIGYHKTGTTWLQKCVFRSTKAGFSFVAGGKTLRPAFVEVDPSSFDPESARRAFEPKIRRAHARSLVPVLSAERLSGNPLSKNDDSAAIAVRLAAAFPDARVLVGIREQTSMLVSMYKQYVKRGGGVAFRRYASAAPSAQHREPLFRFDELEYHHLIGHYQNLFDATNVLVVPYELLQTQPGAFLERIGEFLGVPATEAEYRRMNISPSALSLSLKRHANRYVVRDKFNPDPLVALDGSNNVLMRMCRELDARVPAAVRDGYERRLHRYAEREVGARYEESNALTAKLTGIDLEAFGYACA
jgi:Sulfotransferase domain